MMPGSQQFLGLGVDHELTRWLPTCRMRLVELRGLDDLRAVGIDVDHRLFEVDVLARLHRIDGGCLVPVVGSRDQHGIDILAREDLRSRAW